MLINKKLRERRKQLGLTMKNVADIVGVSEGTISRWETGDISNMRRDRIALYAKALKIDTSDVMGMDNEPSNIGEIMPQSSVHMIPVFESVSAGFGAYACDDIIDYIPITIVNPYDVDDTIGIKVVGDSMYPKIENGDTVIVRKQDSVDSGSIAVLLIDDEDGVVKRIIYGDNWIELQSVNPMYPPRKFEDADVQRIRVVGLVKAIIKTL